jgi:methionyl aminopeptidase
MIEIKTAEEISRMRCANLIVAEVLDELTRNVRPGVTTAELDRIAETLTVKRGARGVPGANVEAASSRAPLHLDQRRDRAGIPIARARAARGTSSGYDWRHLRGLLRRPARTVAVGQVGSEDERLMKVTGALWAGIAEAHRPPPPAICRPPSRSASSGRASVARDFGRLTASQRGCTRRPQVPNYGVRDRGRAVREGMVLAIEPMVNAGGPEVRIKDDGWTAVTQDGRRSAHSEHSVAITGDEPFVLSRPSAPDETGCGRGASREGQGIGQDEMQGLQGRPDAAASCA